MLKKLIDTNIFIDRFYRPQAHRDMFLSEGVVYLSSMVLMELRAGAHGPEAVKAVKELADFFRRLDRIIVPSLRDYERAGQMLAQLQTIKGYDLKKSASITNDCLLAASARSLGAVLFTQNKKDFQAIREVFDFMVIYL